MAHVRQSRPDSGLGFQERVIEIIQGVHFSLGSGEARFVGGGRVGGGVCVPIWEEWGGGGVCGRE